MCSNLSSAFATSSLIYHFSLPLCLPFWTSHFLDFPPITLLTFLISLVPSLLSSLLTLRMQCSEFGCLLSPYNHSLDDLIAGNIIYIPMTIIISLQWVFLLNSRLMFPTSYLSSDKCSRLTKTEFCISSQKIAPPEIFSVSLERNLIFPINPGKIFENILDSSH